MADVMLFEHAYEGFGYGLGVLAFLVPASLGVSFMIGAIKSALDKKKAK